MKGPVREVIPLLGQEMLVRVPQGRRVKSVSLLVSGAKAQARHEGGALRVKVPRIDLHEVVAVDFM